MFAFVIPLAVHRDVDCGRVPGDEKSEGHYNCRMVFAWEILVAATVFAVGDSSVLPDAIKPAAYDNDVEGRDEKEVGQGETERRENGGAAEADFFQLPFP